MQITKLLPQPSNLLILYGLSVMQINRPLPQAVLTRAERKYRLPVLQIYSRMQYNSCNSKHRLEFQRRGD